MALKNCIECSGVLSDKAFFCPHCGLPMGDPAHFFCYPTFLLIRDFGEKRANLNEGGHIVKRYIGGPQVKISGEYKGQPPDYLRGKMDLLDKYFKVIGTAYFRGFSGWNKGAQRVSLQLQCEISGGSVTYSAAASALEQCAYIIQCKCGKDRHYISPSREIDSTVIEDSF